MTLKEYQRLVAAGVIDKVEFIDGEVRMGEHRLAFSASQIEAAAKLALTREEPDPREPHLEVGLPVAEEAAPRRSPACAVHAPENA